jgi:hypothetical protein
LNPAIGQFQSHKNSLPVRPAEQLVHGRNAIVIHDGTVPALAKHATASQSTNGLPHGLVFGLADRDVAPGDVTRKFHDGRRAAQLVHGHQDRALQLA